MKYIFNLLFLLAVTNCFANNNDFQMKMNVINSDGALFQRAIFGIDENATDGLDAELKEFEIPALFPTILSAAFSFYEPQYSSDVLSYIDIRPDFKSDRDSIVYNLEVTGIISSFNLQWGFFPEGVKSANMRSKYLSDKYNYIDMMKDKNLEVTNSAVTDFVITLYNFENTVDAKDDAISEIQIVKKMIKFRQEDLGSKFEILDLNGKIVMQDYANEYCIIDKLASGVYFIKVYNNKISSTQKFVKM